MRGLSLGTGVILDHAGNAMGRTQDELSLCVEPKRAGCYIDSVDGRDVRPVSVYSNKGAPSRASLPLTLPAKDKGSTQHHCQSTHIHRQRHAPKVTAHESACLPRSPPLPPPTRAHPANSEGMVTKESYDELKRQLEKNKVDSDRLARLDAKERETLAMLQPAVSELVEMEMKDNPQFSELKGVGAWAKDFHTTGNIDANMGIARLIACNSARYKRVREEASQSAETSTLLAAANKELEEVKADRDAKGKRVDEQSAHIAELQGNYEKLEKMLRDHQVVTDKLDFSKASSRETGASNAAVASSPAADPVATNMGELFAYVSRAERAAVGSPSRAASTTSLACRPTARRRPTSPPQSRTVAFEPRAAHFTRQVDSPCASDRTVGGPLRHAWVESKRPVSAHQRRASEMTRRHNKTMGE